MATKNANSASNLEYFNKRKTQLQDVRRQQFGVNLDTIWKDADEAYIPHRLKAKAKRMYDEDKGWRGTFVQLGTSDWQSDISQNNVYIKIQTAIAILIDRNPGAVLTPGAKRYQATTSIMEKLYERSWEIARSKAQLKLFVFNLAKYGWACARTYPLRLVSNLRQIKNYDEENPSKNTYTKKEVVEYNDVYRENLSPWNCWIDDMARPNEERSIRDWMWRKVYSMDSAEDEFGKYSKWKEVEPGGIVTDKITGTDVEKKFKEDKLVEIYFYENKLKDLFMVVANGVPIVDEPLPIEDAEGRKKLSLWQTYWTIRHAECPYGIGIYEAIRYDQALLDRFSNMTIDQITLMIYKMFFYQGTDTLTETGDIVIRPGVGKQVIDPKSITWLEVPGPGRDAYEIIDRLQKRVDDSSGISASLEGEITGKTAFEIAQAKESALKRLKIPLDNVLEALETEGYITISLIQLLYSIPETYKIVDTELIEAYLQEIDSDPELYERDEDGTFTAKLFREIPLHLDKDEGGNLVETQDTRFFRLKPKALDWRGVIHIKAQSILSPSKQIDKALELEMYNMLIPLLAQPVQVYHKIARNIVKLYDKNPKDVLPDEWLSSSPKPNAMQAAMSGEHPLFTEKRQPGNLESETLVQSKAIPERPRGVTERIMSRMSAPFRKI
jgi:hypothetical protein